MTENLESNRDRVRRVLFGPLGFRWPKGKGEADGRAELDRIADELGYLGDDDLTAMVRMMRVHGEGSAKCFWPPRATFVAFAHYVRPRPLTQDPALLRWWASVEGQRMVQDGTLVETYGYFERNRRPPVGDGPRRFVLETAQRNAHRLQLIAEREANDWPQADGDLAWRRGYLAKRVELEALVAEAQAQRMQRAS